MALPVVPNLVQLEIIALLDDQEYTNVCFYLCTAEPSSTELETLAASWYDRYLTSLIPFHTSTFLLVAAKATYLGDASRPEQTFVPTSAAEGTETGLPLPNNAAICLSKLTTGTPTIKRGRLYMSGFAQDELISPNTWDETFVSNIVSSWGDVLTFMNSLGTPAGNMVVVSGYRNDALPADVVTGEWNAVVARDRIVDSMRRRLPGRGR